MNSTKKILLNCFVFILLFTITYSIIFKDQNINTLIYNLKGLKYIYLILGMIVMLGYFTIESYNTKKILESFNDKISLLKSLKFTLIGFFFSSITPASTGGQPMQIYYMAKEKISISHSTMALLINLCAYNFNTIFIGLFCAILNPDILNGNIIYLFLLGTLFNSLSLTITLIFIFNKRLSNKLVNLFIKLLKLFKYKNIDQFTEKMNKELKIYSESAEYIKTHKETLFKAVVRAFLQMALFHTLPFFTYKAFGLSGVNIVEFMIIQSILHGTVASIPLPGTIGINESVFLILYGTIFGELLLTNALVVHRIISFYIYVLISLFVLIGEIIYLSKKSKN